MPMLMLIMDTGEVMVDGDGEDMVDTIDHGDMGIGDVRRGQLMMKKQLLDPMLTLMLMLGMVTMVMVWDMDMAWDMDMVDITDHGDMATGDVRRGPLTSQLSPDLILMLMPMLMLGMVTMVMPGHGDMDMVDTTDLGDMATGDARRGPLTSHPSLDLILMLMPMLMLGMATMVMPGHGDMDMVDTTDHGDMDTGEERRGQLTMK